MELNEASDSCLIWSNEIDRPLDSDANSFLSHVELHLCVNQIATRPTWSTRTCDSQPFEPATFQWTAEGSYRCIHGLREKEATVPLAIFSIYLTWNAHRSKSNGVPWLL